MTRLWLVASKDKSLYPRSFQVLSENETLSCQKPTHIPKITNLRRIPFDEWRSIYGTYITTIASYILSSIHEESNDTCMVSVNNSFVDGIAEYLYRTSWNACKDYIFLK
jgi:hypothetical protein